MFASAYAKSQSADARGMPPASWTGAGQMSKVNASGMRGTCVVRLIDRRTGLTHRLGGSPLVIFTRDPVEAARELLAGRDTAIWEVRVDPIEA